MSRPDQPFQVSAQSLPPSDSTTFRDSSFFTRNPPGTELPTPADVRALAAVQDPSSVHYDYGLKPVRYEELSLIVKYGKAPLVTVAEAQCLWALRRVLPAVPVPEVYGWTHDEGMVFIFMELVPGETLEQRWEHLDKSQRGAVCEQLRGMVSALRSLRPSAGEEVFIGHINHEPVGDYIFNEGTRGTPGPFACVSEFHDWISNELRAIARKHWPGKELWEIPDPYRSGLPDDADIVFTHADLHPSNIIVSTTTPCKVVALIDWRQSGWYPDYWEFFKANITADFTGEWARVYIPLFLTPYSASAAIDDYARSFGC